LRIFLRPSVCLCVALQLGYREVGASVTPNSYEEARRQVADGRQYERTLGGPLQLAACCASAYTCWCSSSTVPMKSGVLPQP
jgi:hypothetical protein